MSDWVFVVIEPSLLLNELFFLTTVWFEIEFELKLLLPNFDFETDYWFVDPGPCFDNEFNFRVNLWFPWCCNVDFVPGDFIYECRLFSFTESLRISSSSRPESSSENLLGLLTISMKSESFVKSWEPVWISSCHFFILWATLFSFFL